MKKNIKPETLIMRQIKEYLEYRGWFVYRNHQSLGSYPGIPDLTALKNGRVVWIEVKRPGGKISEPQASFANNIQGQECEWFCLYSLDDAMEVFK
ncbi:MAG: VRR-NUC domain-containing protein [Acidobacteriota bacterium]